jgi:hypothetical protein
MRGLSVATLVVASVLTSPHAKANYVGNVGPGALLLWPTARSTALGGAMTGLADEADAAVFNPAGLAFQATAKADITYANNWLPGLYLGMRYASAIGGAPIHMPFLCSHKTYVSGSAVYLTTGETDIVNERGEFLGRVTTWRGTAGLQVGTLLTNRLGAGIGLKVLHDSRYAGNWFWGETYTEATAAAVDIALLYRLSRVSIGAAVCNLGPPIVYRPSDELDELPRIARLGLCWTPIENRNLRLRVMPEFTKVLVGMFSDTTGKSFGRQLDEEWRDAWKAVGIEVTPFNLVFLRLGYFEDLTDQRGGIVLEREGQTYHYGLWDALSRRGLGQLKSIGLCWGFGVGNNALRFDVSSDAAIYDFETSNWKFSLVANDIAGGIRELRQGHKPWEQ